MNKQNKGKSQKPRVHNTLESIKDVGTAVKKSVKEDVIGKMPEEFVNQLFGWNGHITGEIGVGETIEFRESTQNNEEKKFLRKQMLFETRIRRDEEAGAEKRMNELKMQLQAVMEEVVKLTDQTDDLAKEVKIAAMQAPIEPGIYHVLFFEKLLIFLKSFKKKIEQASTWLHSSNTRAQKKNYWSMYKKHGSKFLLSGEHYLTRSAG
jgi:hypothetical protein